MLKVLSRVTGKAEAPKGEWDWKSGHWDLLTQALDPPWGWLLCPCTPSHTSPRGESPHCPGVGGAGGLTSHPMAEVGG